MILKSKFFGVHQILIYIFRLRRDGKASVRSGMQTLTERRKINISGEYHLTNSGKLTDWYSFVNKSASKRASSQA